MDEPTVTGATDADRESAPAERIAPGTDDGKSPADGDGETRSGDDAEPTADADGHAARAALYGLLGGTFVYPDAETLADLTAPEVREGVGRAADQLGLRAAADDLLDALAAADVETLQATYNKLFGLPDGGEYPVIPYEGHYTTGSEISEEQRRIAAVVGLMEEFGVRPSEDFDERQDHVAAELELMQVVAAQRAAAVHRGDRDAAETLADAEATILDEHLIAFVPSFAVDLRAATSNDVYGSAAALAEALVRRDHGEHDTAEAPSREVETNG